MSETGIFAADQEGLAAAAAALRAGGVIGFPTDTVYGLAASAALPEAVARVSAIKGRSSAQPLILMVADPEELAPYAVMPELARRLAERHWPGALTLILPALPGSGPLGGGATVGVRIPRHPVALELLRLAGPLATTSANRHGESPAAGALAALEQLSGLAGAILELPSDRVVGEPSSILDLSSNEPRLIREGRLDRAALGLSEGGRANRRD
ncbi:MAG: L-threonylcarbamoyladenylate synthase [Candidatus Dormibacteria bacterium]